MHADESLHSFLLRQQLMCSSKFDPKGVISRDGKWICPPYAHADVKHVFERFDDLFLLECVETGTGYVTRSDSFFQPPDLYCSSLYDVFFREKGVKYTKPNALLDIKYCPKCIKGMIYKYGYGYFRKKWNDCEWCDEHDISLRKITSDSYKVSVKLVQELLQGKEIPSCISKAYQECKVKDKTKKYENNLDLYYPINATICSAKLIGKFLSPYRYILFKDFPFMTHAKINALISFNEDLLNFYGEAMRVGAYDMASLQCFEPLVDYLSTSLFSYYEVPVGPREQFSEILIIPDSAERFCKDCFFSGCRELVEKAKKLDNCHRDVMLQNSTSYNRFVSDFPVIRLIDDISWSPIVIYT